MSKRWLFPELTRSFLQIFMMQMLAFFILIGVIGFLYGWLWFAIAFALSMLKDCIIVQSGIRAAEARQSREAVALAMAQKRDNFGVTEQRLLDRTQMEIPPPTHDGGTAELLPPDAYGR